MNDNEKEWEIVFAPGCFDNFEGTQEELDGLIAALKQSVKDGSLFENSINVDDDYDDLPEAMQDWIDMQLDPQDELDEITATRNKKLN